MSATAIQVETGRKLSILLDPATYSDETTKVELKETHMSWVFLTDRFAFKVKKPIQYDEQDYTTLRARFVDASTEIELNRRFGGNLYIGVVPLTYSEKEGWRIGGKGEVVEWMVQMRRLPDERLMDHLIRAKKITQSDIRDAAEQLAKFYVKGRPVQMTGEEYAAKLLHEVELNHAVLSDPDYGFAKDRIEILQRGLSFFVRDFSELLIERVQQGRIVDGHGDLRPEHICIEPDHLVTIFDCLQFSRDLRITDSVDELSFLALECERLGDPDSGEALLQTYFAITNDVPPDPLIAFYKSYRAGMWARLALLRTRDSVKSERGKWLKRACQYLTFSEKYADQLPLSCC
jgi:aminoglycoside phosphotransferase family enzyme